jgi:hypothetical protein
VCQDRGQVRGERERERERERDREWALYVRDGGEREGQVNELGFVAGFIC